MCHLHRHLGAILGLGLVLLLLATLDAGVAGALGLGGSAASRRPCRQCRQCPRSRWTSPLLLPLHVFRSSGAHSPRVSFPPSRPWSHRSHCAPRPPRSGLRSWSHRSRSRHGLHVQMSIPCPWRCRSPRSRPRCQCHVYLGVLPLQLRCWPALLTPILDSADSPSAVWNSPVVQKTDSSSATTNM